jgi:Arm DNA-binding domain
MPSRALTAAAVDRIKAPARGQIDYFDKGYPGLALRVSYGGAKAWVYFFRLHGGKLRRVTLGRWPAMDLAAARGAWQEARKKVGKGENPTPRKPTPADGFAANVDRWLTKAQRDNRSFAEVKRVIDRDIRPGWEDRLVASISRRDVSELIDDIVDRGAVTLARRVHAHLHRFFRWSVGEGIILHNPMAHMLKPGTAVKRDRVLSDHELALLWKAVNWDSATKIGWPFGPAIRLLLLTGAPARRDWLLAAFRNRRR